MRNYVGSAPASRVFPVTRSILMSIYRTLKRRGLDPLEETETALRPFMQTGEPPPLPTKICSGG